ncbi:MAG: dCTP deaminase [candidate division WOR-3 bacterium]
MAELTESGSGFLTSEGIKSALESGRLVITPLLEESQIGQASIDLRLGSEILVMKQTQKAFINPVELTPQTARNIQGPVNLAIGIPFILHPGQLILGVTLEYISLGLDLCGMILSRSRFGRTGLIVATASFIHPGWKGCLTLELCNAGVLPLFLYCGSPIAQLAVANAYPPLENQPQALIPTRPRLAEMSKMIDWSKLKKFQGIWEQQGSFLTSTATSLNSDNKKKE